MVRARTLSTLSTIRPVTWSVQSSWEPGTGAVPLRAAGAAAVGAAGGPAVAVASEPLLSLMARSLGRSTVRRRPSWPLAQSRLQVAAS